MSQHIEQLTRLKLYDELSDIVSAMKNLAQVELHKLAKIDIYQEKAVQATLHAISKCHDHSSNLEKPNHGHSTLILLGSERGFCGGFNEQVARAFEHEMAYHDHLIVIGHRLANKIENQSKHSFYPAPSTADEVFNCAQGLFETLSDKDFLGQITVIYHSQHGVEKISLLASPQDKQHRAHKFVQMNTSASKLVTSLQNLSLKQGLILYLLRSLKTENKLRLQQMDGAKNHLDELSHILKLRMNSLRQQEIVEEIEVIFGNQLATNIA